MQLMSRIVNKLITILECHTCTIIQTFLHDEPKRVPIMAVNGPISREFPYHTARL